MQKAIAAILAFSAAGYIHAQEATYTVRHMVPEMALRAAQAALESCRKAGYQVAVAIVDRSGLPQVLLRDPLAGAHTVDMAIDKAWTAVSFRTSTAVLAEATQGAALAGIRHRPRVTTVGGGLVIEGAGAMLGGIGVSGAPGGDRDEACARVGIAAVQAQLDF